MEQPPVALTVAGSDSGGGAGIQADLKTMEACGAFGTSAVTALTAQNTLGVQDVEPVSPEFVAGQIDAVVDDLPVAAAKTGMLGDVGVVDTVAEKVAEHGLTTVVDPVMVAESGDRLLSEDAERVVRDRLVPEATLVTPNAEEAEVLTDVEVEDVDSAAEAAAQLVDIGADAALVKGGHLDGDGVVDILHAGEGATEFRKPRIDTDDTHGTGCTLSSAITAELAGGADLVDAVASAEDLIHRAVRYAYSYGEGAGPVHHLAELRNEAARRRVVDEVVATLRAFEDADVSALVPEVGLNFAVATSYAMSEDDVAAFDGRLTRTTDGVAAHGVDWRASGHVARFLLAVREHDPSVRAACNVRNSSRLLEAVESRWHAVEFDRTGEPDDASTMEWSAERAFEASDGTPDAVVDHGAHGKEPMIRLLGEYASTLRERVLELAAAVEDDGAEL